MTDPDDESVEIYSITLLRDIQTDVGTLAAGTQLPAAPSLNDGWLLELSIPLRGAPSHPFEVKARNVLHGRLILSKRAAVYDYRFARRVLGYSHHSALTWLLQGYGVTERQLYRWGLTEQGAEEVLA